ncbi:hypothetical protein [Paludisphaera borealis]|uniref:Uncharacterized protein n=1 Tax=Paludisphaera borealis TaxID=1387353 RepID=A0A1U7CZD7_9BACT|nr:hypothetical protein [Paludisphaera borealis]APW64320.1 hypothetical protein BSF38_20041 [Paludisphaera borealis]
MKDPHVETLRYKLEVDQTYGRIENPPPLIHETEAYRMCLENDVLVIDMKEHHATIQSARNRVEPDLEAWQLDAALQREHMWLRFIYDEAGAVVKDLHIWPEGHNVATGSLVIGPIIVSGTGTCGPPVFQEYPQPPKRFRASEDVEAMFRRYERAVWRDETQLLSTGYACLSLMEGAAAVGSENSSRNKAVDKYNIHIDVFDALGTIVSTYGSLEEARKLHADAKREALSHDEKIWVRAAIRTLIRRKAEYDHDPREANSLPQIIMEDLPTLTTADSLKRVRKPRKHGNGHSKGGSSPSG